MAEAALQLVPDPDPSDDTALLQLRARVATDVAAGRNSDGVLAYLAETIATWIPGSTVIILTIDEHDIARIRASNAPVDIQRLIHGIHRRGWFGTWAAAIARHSEVVVPEIAASSLYREHRGMLVKHEMLSARAAPLCGRHNLVAGALAVYVPAQRLLTPVEIDLFDEAASLAELSIGSDHARQELLDRIRHDPLTGLENRDGLEDHIRCSLAAAAGQNGRVGLLFVDIDDLTLVNDSLGHTAGDTVIAVTAERIKSQLLPGDVVVRFGGDEFIVVLETIGSVDDACRVAERVRDAIGRPMRLGDSELTTTVSIGITVGHPDVLPLELIDEGHAAVVRAKQSGRGSTAVHDRVLDTGAGARLGRELRLRQGLDDSEFILFWQPKVAVATGRIVGAEALVRWQHPEDGLIGPDQFIPTAERSGLMTELSNWILHQAVRETAEYSAIDDEFSVAVNMSATQITRDDFIQSLAAIIESAGVRPGTLIIELTESVLADTDVVQRLHDLRRLGVRVAIDDFGTGYSSLAYVQQLPVRMVKIDRAFLGGLESDGSGAPVLQAAVAMAQALGLKTTVEGVETNAQLAGLRELGVDWAQGYLFSEPVPQQVLLSMLKN